MEKCGKCGHPKAAHALQPERPMCQNCHAVKALRLNAQHYFRTEAEMSVR